MYILRQKSKVKIKRERSKIAKEASVNPTLDESNYAVHTSSNKSESI